MNMQCAPCPAGTAAIPDLSFIGFDAFTDTWRFEDYFTQQQCVGQCAGCHGQSATQCTTTADAFVVESISADPASRTPDKDVVVVVRTNPNSGSRYTSSITFPFSVTSPGSITITYFFLFPGQAAGTAVVSADAFTAFATVDNVEHPLNSESVRPDGGSLKIAVPRVGAHELRITVQQREVVNGGLPPVFALTGLAVFGDPRGAASTCDPCPTGSYCPSQTDKFVPCPVSHYSSTSGSTSCKSCQAGFVAKDVGQAFCRQCPPGTQPAATGDRCVPTCDITFPTGRFVLEPFRNMTFGPIFRRPFDRPLTPGAADAADETRFYISLCDYVNSKPGQDTCRRRSGQDIERAFSCERINADRGYSSGDFVRYSLSPTGQLVVMMEGGDVCSHGGMERTTNVTFTCMPSMSGLGELSFVSEFPHCTYNFQLASQYACPICTSESFSKSVGLCDKDGFRTIQWLKRPGLVPCAGGFVPSAPTKQSCDFCKVEDYEKHWTECRQGWRYTVYVLRANRTNCTYDEHVTNPVERQPCRVIDARVGLNTFTIVLLIVAIALLLLVVLLTVVYHKHRTLSVQYARLSSSATESNEMHDVTVDEDVPDDA